MVKKVIHPELMDSLGILLILQVVKSFWFLYHEWRWGWGELR